MTMAERMGKMTGRIRAHMPYFFLVCDPGRADDAYPEHAQWD
jgi:hypothetical protein